MTLLDDYRGDGPLRDVTILDFSQMMMGPLATQLMGDLGALVIKVERPGVGEWERSYIPQGRTIDGESPYFLAMNRNKVGLAADLKDPDDLAMIRELIPHVDAVVHNFRPGVMDRRDLGYDDLSELNPALVYASGSGFGERGPWVARPGQDLLVQAASGLAAATGPGDVPPVPNATPIVDASTGFLLAFSIVSGILDARSSGRGRQVGASLLGTALLMQCQEAVVELNTELRYERSDGGLAAPWVDAPYGIYATSDGYLALAMVEPELLVEVLDLDEDHSALSAQEMFANRDEISARVADRLASRTTDEWLERLGEHDVWCAPVLELGEVLEHEQVRQNQLVEDIPTPGGGSVRAVGMAVAVSGVESAARLPAPRVGEHNDEIATALRELRDRMDDQ